MDDPIRKRMDEAYSGQVPNRRHNRKLLARYDRQKHAIHVAIHIGVVYDVLPMTSSAVRALLCR